MYSLVNTTLGIMVTIETSIRTPPTKYILR